MSRADSLSSSELRLICGGHRWPWATGRLSAGFVLDLRDDPAVGKALMFFHGSDYPENDARGGFDTFASVRSHRLCSAVLSSSLLALLLTALLALLLKYSSL